MFSSINFVEIVNNMKKDGIKNAEERMQELENYLEELKNPGSTKKKEAPPPKKELPEELKKYLKQLKMLPENAVLNNMKKDGMKRAEAEKKMEEIQAFLHPEKAKMQIKVENIPPKPLPKELKKYCRMMKMLPRHAIVNKMKVDGIKNAEKRMQEIEAHLGKRSPEAPKVSRKKKLADIKRHAKSKWSESTFWKDCTKNEKEAEDIFSGVDLLETFKMTKRAAPKAAKATEKKKKKPKIVEVNLVLDGKKKQRMDFFVGSLRRLNITYRDVRNAIWAINTGKLSDEMLDSLCATLPEIAEIEGVKAYKGDYGRLNKPSQLWYNIMNIPRVKLRMSNWIFTNGFPESLEKVDEQIKILEKSIWGIRDNKSLHNMFLLILDVLKACERGKYFDGFPLRNLYTVVRKPCSDGKTTWLQKLCRMCSQRKPANLKFVEDLQCLKEAERSRDLGGIQKQIQELKMGRNKIVRFLTAYEKNPPTVDDGSHDGCAAFFGKFITDTLGMVEGLEKRFQTLAMDVKKLAKDLGEPEINDKKQPNTEYLPVIYKFVVETDKAMKKNIAEDKAKERLERIRQKENERKKKRRKKKQSSAGASSSLSRVNAPNLSVNEERFSLSRGPSPRDPLVSPEKPPISPEKSPIPPPTPSSDLPTPLPSLSDRAARARSTSREGSKIQSLSPEMIVAQDSEIANEQRHRRKASQMRGGVLKAQLTLVKEKSRARAKRIRRMSNISFRHSSGKVDRNMLDSLREMSDSEIRRSDGLISPALMRMASGTGSSLRGMGSTSAMSKTRTVPVTRRGTASMIVSPRMTQENCNYFPSGGSFADLEIIDDSTDDEGKSDEEDQMIKAHTVQTPQEVSL